MNAELSRNGELCPACGEGHLTSQVVMERVEYSGRSTDLPLRSSVCDYCGSELTGEAESIANKRAMTAFCKSVDGLLTGQEIRAFRKEYRLSQETAAALFGGGKVAFSRYENDDVTQNTAMDRLLRVCQGEPAALLELAKVAAVELPAETRLVVSQKVLAKEMESVRLGLERLARDADRSVILRTAEIHRRASHTVRHSANDHDFQKFGDRAQPVVVPVRGVASWPREVAIA